MSNRLTSHYLQHKLNPSFVQSFGFKFKLMKVIWSNGKSKAASTLNSSNNCKMPINELLKVIHFDAEKLLSKIFDFYLKIQNTVQNHNNTSERCINWAFIFLNYKLSGLVLNRVWSLNSILIFEKKSNIFEINFSGSK